MKNLLIIEDDPITITLYKYILKKAGFNLFILEDGNEIMQLLSISEIDLIIMDISLKNTYLDNQKIDGIKFSKYIKCNPKYNKIPIIIVTAYSGKIKEENFIKDNMADKIITKPIVDFNMFINIIKEQIKIE